MAEKRARGVGVLATIALAVVLLLGAIVYPMTQAQRQPTLNSAACWWTVTPIGRLSILCRDLYRDIASTPGDAWSYTQGRSYRNYGSGYGGGGRF